MGMIYVQMVEPPEIPIPIHDCIWVCIYVQMVEPPEISIPIYNFANKVHEWAKTKDNLIAKIK